MNLEESVPPSEGQLSVIQMSSVLPTMTNCVLSRYIQPVHMCNFYNFCGSYTKSNKNPVKKFINI